MDATQDYPITTFPSVLALIISRLQSAPDHHAIYFQGQVLSNGELLTRVRFAAAALCAQGIKPGERIGVCIDRHPDILTAILSLWLCQAVYVPLDPASPRERLNVIIEQADIDCVLTCIPSLATVKALPVKPIIIEELYKHNSAALLALSSSELPEPAAANLAYILFTSGSSGMPKGVLISHLNLLTLFRGIFPLLAIPSGWKILGCSHFCFDIAFFELLMPLLSGGSLILADSSQWRNAEALCNLIEQHRIEIVQATPGLWFMLLQHSGKAFTVRLAISTGEKLPFTLACKLLQHTNTLWNLYGPTECTLWAAGYQVTQQALEQQGSISIGRALPGYTLSLLANERGASQNVSIPANKSGELLISGAGVGIGYLSANSAAEADRSRNPFRQQDGQATFLTGDFCSIDDEHNFHFHTRLDTQLKINGYRIEAAEITSHLEAHASLLQACCLARPSSTGMASQLLAFVVAAPGMPNKNKQRLNDYLSHWLPEWMLPDMYFFVDSFPMDSNGKINTRALLDITKPAHPVNTTLEAALFTQIKQIMCSILDVQDIPATQSFFDAGGNSMLCATLVMMLNQQLAVKISLREILRTPPTVNSIYTLVQTALANKSTTLKEAPAFFSVKL